MMSPWEPYVLALGAVVGAFLKAKWTPGQETLSRETLQDCFFALVLGILWPYQVAVPAAAPVIGGLAWPPFQLPAGMPLPIKGVLMAALSALFIGLIKKILIQFPDKFEKLTGSTPPAKTNGSAPVAKIGVVILAALLAGCAGPLGSAGNADQLKELVKVKDANITCIIANTPYGKGSALFLNLDKAVIPQGSISVSDSCNTTITLEPKKP